MTDQRSAAAKRYRRWYKTARWQRMREAQLSAHPLCVYCLEREEVTAADTVDHIKPHRGDDALMWDAENLQSLCASCHSSRGQREDLGQRVIAFGPDGWPLP